MSGDKPGKPPGTNKVAVVKKTKKAKKKAKSKERNA